jgi:hypothetical protein
LNSSMFSHTLTVEMMAERKCVTSRVTFVVKGPNNTAASSKLSLENVTREPIATLAIRR